MTEKSDKPKDSSRRGFMAGAATLGAFAALGDALPMLAKMGPLAGQIDPSMFKLTDYKTVDRVDGSEESATVTIAKNSKSAVISVWARRSESESAYVVFNHVSIQKSDGGEATRIVSIMNATKGEVSGDFRTDTATVSYVDANGGVKESAPRKMRIPLGPNPLEGLTPDQMFDRMLTDKAGAKTPEYLPKEVR
jgi:hypothetical protein